MSELYIAGLGRAELHRFEELCKIGIGGRLRTLRRLCFLFAFCGVVGIVHMAGLNSFSFLFSFLDFMSQHDFFSFSSSALSWLSLRVVSLVALLASGGVQGFAGLASAWLSNVSSTPFQFESFFKNTDNAPHTRRSQSFVFDNIPA